MFNQIKPHVFWKMINKNDIIKMTIYWRRRCRTPFIKTTSTKQTTDIRVRLLRARKIFWRRRLLT